MTLPSPRLDDRTFQDIVDDAKRRITELCPEWTDHNVSDPGVALIELFAWMTELMLYRFNQVPDRLYVKFLELIGIELEPGAPARTDLLFRLVAPQPEPVAIPRGIQVSTARVGEAEPIVFSTDRDVVVTPPNLVACVTRSQDQFVDQSRELLREHAKVPCFRGLLPGDAVYLGFTESLASNCIRLHLETGVEGAGGRPSFAPIRWEYWDGANWPAARVIKDDSKGLNTRAGGDLDMLLGPSHEASTLLDHRLHWVRCKLLEGTEETPMYRKSPVLEVVTAVSIGAVVPAQHGQSTPAEVLGRSNGRPGQSFSVLRTPVLKRNRPEETVRVTPPRGDVGGGPASEDWLEVDHFGAAGEHDRVFVWNGGSGEIRFGPRVVGADGIPRQHGAIPDLDAQISVTRYRFGGGSRGNVGAGKLTGMRTLVPFVDSVTNLDSAQGGVDPETVENAKLRGPMTLRSGDRAVTAQDVERLTAAASPVVARALCIPPEGAGPARVLVVPKVDVLPRKLTVDHMSLGDDLTTTIANFLEPRRMLALQVVIEKPQYQGVMVVAKVRIQPTVREEYAREHIEEALYRFVNPVVGGQDGKGWPFGATVSAIEIHGLLLGVTGVESVGEVVLFEADDAGVPQQRILQQVALAAHALPVSARHRVTFV